MTTDSPPPVETAGAPPRGRGLVEVEGLTWRPYGRREPVLRDVSLRFEPGERVLLVGPSGSGKSTLLRALAGLLETADAGDLVGSVTVDGLEPGARPGGVGLVLQEPGSGVVAATVGRDVAFGPENVRMERAAMGAVVEAALRAVGLGDLPLDTPTSALSGGQTQRLALAGTLALDPSVVLLDEPTAMLDPGSAQEVRDAVASLVGREGAPTLVVVEHVLGPWVDLVDRLVVLSDDGRVVADGPVRETLAGEREALLAMGVWVPGEGAPQPVVVDPAVFGVIRRLRTADVGRSSAKDRAGPSDPGPSRTADVGRSSAKAPDETMDAGPGTPASTGRLWADPLVVERTTRLVDGRVRTRQAAATTSALDARPGTLTALVGPSGSGKSTVLHALAGFLRATDPGAVRVAGPEGVASAPADLSATDLAATLAWVPQWSSSTIVATTVLDEVLATSLALGLDDAATKGRARALLTTLGLLHLQKADPRHLSGGEQRRLAVAAALLHGPAVLLADEPTVGQDRRTWAALVGLVAAYRSAGGAVVAATHDTHVVDRATDVEHLAPPPQPPDDAPTRVPLVARCGPLALLAAALLALPAGVVSPHWSVSLWVLAVEVVLAVIGLSAPGVGERPPNRLRRTVIRLLPGLLAAASVAWSTWLLAGHDLDAAATVALRVLVITLPSAVLIPWIDPDRLGDHLAQRLRLPDRPVVATAAALQRVHSFGEIWRELARARRIRGLGVSWGSPRTVAAHLGALTLGLLVRTLRAAADLAVAMDARGFATASSRTWWVPAPWQRRDTLLLVLAAVPLLVAVTVR